MREPTFIFAVSGLFLASVSCASGPAAREPRAAKPVECAPASAAEPFDRGGAAQALGNVDVQQCVGQGDHQGSARVEVTFCPDGQAHGATVIEGRVMSEAAERCIEERFDGARVAPFSGAPVHVKKAFTLR